MAFLVTEVFGNGKTGKGNTSASSWWLVHLAKDQCDFGLAVKLDDLGFLHFVIQIIALTGTFTNTSEHRVTTVGFGDVVLPLSSVFVWDGKVKSSSNDALKTYDQLLDEHSFADTCTSKKTNLSPTCIRSK